MTDKNRIKVILLGKGQMLANMIEASLEADVDIAGVFRYERTLYSGFKLLLHDLFKTSHDLTLIKKYKLPEVKCKSANSEAFRNYILKTNADLIIVGTWREKLKKDTFAMPRIGTVNIHPSLLPRYRGPNPYMQVVLNGELRERDFSAARELAREFLLKIQREVIIPIKQNESRSSYYGYVDETLKMLDFKNNTSEEIVRIIKALYPWMPCYITVGNHFLKVNPYKIKIENPQSDVPAGYLIGKNPKEKSLTIVCKDGKALEMRDLKLWGFFISPFTRFFIKLIR